jgi:hypothetical protein
MAKAEYGSLCLKGHEKKKIGHFPQYLRYGRPIKDIIVQV